MNLRHDLTFFLSNTRVFFSLSLSLSENPFLLNLWNPSETPLYRDPNFLNTFFLSHFRLNLVDNKGRKKGRDLFKTLVPMLFQMRHTNPSDTFDFFLLLSPELQKPERERETERERKLRELRTKQSTGDRKRANSK